MEKTDNKKSQEQEIIDILATRVSHDLGELYEKSPKLYEAIIRRSLPLDSGYVFEYKDEAIGWNHE